jgi:hypothetical protein
MSAQVPQVRSLQFEFTPSRDWVYDAGVLIFHHTGGIELDVKGAFIGITG